VADDNAAVVTEAEAPALVEADPSRPYKAYVGAALTVVCFVVAFVIYAWLTDNTPRKAPNFTQSELKDAVGAGLAAGFASALPIGGGVFLKGNPKRIVPQHKRNR
jgi:hypothetical protein